MPDIVIEIIQVCIIPLLGIITKYLVDFLQAKRDEINDKIDNETVEKYTKMIFDTVTACVITTNQTYVNSLKEQGKFDEEAQKKAFDMTMSAVLDILSEDVKKYMKEFTGDLNAYLTNLIEAQVFTHRMVVE